MNREDAQKVITTWCEEELYKASSEGKIATAIVPWLYDNGYVLVNPEEVKRIDGALTLSRVHGRD